MAHALSASQVTELEQYALRTKNALAKAKQKTAENIESIVETAELSTAAFAMGVIDGRFGGVEVIGMPLSLLSAAGSHLLGFLGVASPHMHAFGNGFLANYLTTLGNGVGAKMLAEAAKKAG